MTKKEKITQARESYKRMKEHFDWSDTKSVEKNMEKLCVEMYLLGFSNGWNNAQDIIVDDFLDTED